MRLFKDKLFRNIFISVVLLAVLGGAYYAVMKMPDKTDVKPSSTPSPEISSSDITVFETDVKAGVKFCPEEGGQGDANGCH